MPIANEVHFSSSAAGAPVFLRNGLKSDDVEVCSRIIRDRYTKDCTITPVNGQGGCSYTVVVVVRGRHDKAVDVDVVVQFRFIKHAILRAIAQDVRRSFGDLVPDPVWFEEFETRGGVKLQACAMTVVKGRAFGDLQPCERRLWKSDYTRLRGLMLDMACFFATGWRAAVKEPYNPARVDGKVGCSIRQRLVLLESGLPTFWLRARARMTRHAFDSGLLDCLPIALNHGDLLPTNIMVEHQSWRLTGLVDWAEAEYLPFGMTLYGLEHLLGFMGNDHQRFVYYEQANELRNVFWQRLRIELPELADRSKWKAMKLSREIGILLWHGIAWDDGKLNRVVDYEHDREEVACLESFLGGSHGFRDSKL